MAQAHDAIIIGGGIMGCSTALALAQRGLSVGLLEKGTIGINPSGKSSAIIRQHYSNKLTAAMARYSLDVFQNFAAAVGGECGFTRTGFVALVAAGRDPRFLMPDAVRHEINETKIYRET